MGEPSSDSVRKTKQNKTNTHLMKTTLLALFTTMLVAAASAAPLPPYVSAAAAGAAASLNHSQPLGGSSFTVTPFTPRIDLVVPAAPQLVPVVPASASAAVELRAVQPIRAARAIRAR